MDCVKFKQKTATERKNFVKEQKLCFNCLSKAHMLKECQSEFRCRVDGCRQKHHTLLHKEPLDNQNGNSDNRKQSPPQNNIPTDDNVNSFSKSNLRGPFLQVLPVYVTDINGKRFKANTLLDSGSTMRALHLELVDSLTTESFILALSRFIARRGHVKIITSENGNNFIGGEYKLRALVKDLDNKKITQHLNSKNIAWKFNPPLSPWIVGS